MVIQGFVWFGSDPEGYRSWLENVTGCRSAAGLFIALNCGLIGNASSSRLKAYKQECFIDNIFR